MPRIPLGLVAASMALAFMPAFASCEGDIPIHLEWCSRQSSGVNEGASCGFNALTGTGVSLPLNLGDAVLANTWTRTNMMGATIAAFRLGFQDPAIAAATCCQIHNGGAYQCLASRPDIVADWLSSK